MGAMTSSLNSFDSKSTLDVAGRSLTLLLTAQLSDSPLRRRPPPLLHQGPLENLLRNEDGVKVTAGDIEALARWARDAFGARRSRRR